MPGKVKSKEIMYQAKVKNKGKMCKAKVKNKEIMCQNHQPCNLILYAQDCKLTDLKQHTTYIVRCKAVNPLGESNWSEQISVTTQVIE